MPCFLPAACSALLLTSAEKGGRRKGPAGQPLLSRRREWWWLRSAKSRQRPAGRSGAPKFGRGAGGTHFESKRPASMSNFSEQADRITHEEGRSLPTNDSFERRVFRATAIVLATLAAAYVLWLLIDVLLLLFACSLVSLILLTLTNALRRRTHLPFAPALVLSVLGLLALIGGAFAFFGTAIQG